MRSLAPAWAYGILQRMEALLSPLNGYLAMFAVIVLERAGGRPGAPGVDPSPEHAAIAAVPADRGASGVPR